MNESLRHMTTLHNAVCIYTHDLAWPATEQIGNLHPPKRCWWVFTRAESFALFFRMGSLGYASGHGVFV
jgi:hypothetical protein